MTGNTEVMIERLPQDFTLRHPTLDDIEAVTKLLNACEIAEDGQAETTIADMRTYWQRPGFNLATDAWVVLSPQGRIVASASVGQREHVRIFTGADVHPEYRGRGIGTQLLRVAEVRAYQYVPEATPGARVALLTQVSSKNVVAQSLLEKHGFTQVRHFWRMGIEVHELPPGAQWSEGITVRTMTPGIERAVFEADDEAFRDHWGYIPEKFEDWAHWTFKREGFDPSLWFLAMDGEEIAGIALCADEKEAGGWVHVLGVRRRWRRRGVGLALLHHAFAEFYRRDIHNVYLGVDAQSLTGATRLYERAGMHVVRQYKSYEKELRAGKELSTQSVEV
jgi:mycothiol synthase